MSSDLGEIAQLLDATLDPSKHKKGMCAPRHSSSLGYLCMLCIRSISLTCHTAESALKLEEKKPQYSLQLLKIVASDTFPHKIRLSAALAFKNFIRHNYVVSPRISNPFPRLPLPWQS